MAGEKKGGKNKGTRMEMNGHCTAGDNGQQIHAVFTGLSNK
jgi:hypothetical protein